MRVIVADNHSGIRSALRLLLEEKPGIKVVVEVGTTRDLISQVRTTCPDLALIDWELPGSYPCQLLSLLHNLCPHLSIISMGNGKQTRDEALIAGAREFICKEDSPEKLTKVLDRWIMN
jgi:DNA-binding NarL/FixJ family response regulator